jgi:autotransporter-associated beta strand protein
MNVSSLSADFVAKRKSARVRWTCFAAIILFCFVGAINGAQAQTYQTWRGENTQGNLLDANAWWNFPNNSTMVFGQQEFDNNVQTLMTNNNGGNVFGTWRWVFKGGATTARTITGDGLRFFDFGGQNPGIHNESSATHIFNVAVSGDGSADDPFEIRLNNTGGLTFGSTVNNEGQNIEILGTASGAKTVTFSGIVSGSGGMYVNNGNATVLFDAANDYSGQLTINAGTVKLNGIGDTFGASTQAIRIGSGASINLNGVNTTVGSVGEEGSSDGGSISLGAATLTISGSATTFQNGISGSGGISHTGSGTLNLFGTQSYTGATAVSAGTVATSGAMSSSSYNITGTGIFSTSTANLISDTATVTLADTGSLSLGGNDTVGALSGSGGTISLGSSTLTTSSASSTTYSGTISGTGGLTKSGSGTLTLSGSSANTYTGLTTVSGGTLELNKSSGNAIAGATTINSGAVLLLSASNQVDSGAGDTVTLSGGTIQRASGVSEVFGNLNVTQASVINYSGGTGNSLTFTGLNYTPDGTLILELQNFTQGNTLVIQNTSNWSSLINTGFTFAGSGGFGSSSFVDNGGGIGTFTITAIPEPSTYAAAAGLLAMFLWPVRRRVIKDVKSILGLRPTGRERIEAYRKA